MKKLASLLLALALLSCCLPVLAETDYTSLTESELRAEYQAILTEMGKRIAPEKAALTTDQEITFRGMPWGISATAFADTMKQSGVSASARARTIYSWERENLAKSEVAYASRPDNRGFEYSVSPSDFTVAGLPVSKIAAYFTYGFDDDNVYDTPDKASLFHAIYHFDGVADKQSMAAMLHQKLCALYGEVPMQQSTNSYSNYTCYYDYAIWYGPDDTALLLCNSYYLNSDGTPHDGYTTYFSLHYGKSNSVQLIDELNAAVAREELEAFMESSSSDGL